MADVTIKRRGYISAVAGALLGGLLAGMPVWILTQLLVVGVADPPEAEIGLAAAILAPIVALAFMLCAVVGCWAALRARGHSRVGRTVALLTPLMLLGAALSAAWDASRIDDRPSPLDDVPFRVMYFVILVGIPVTATLLARYLATRC